MLAESLKGVVRKRSPLATVPGLQPATRFQIILQTHDTGHPTWLACMEDLPCPPEITAIKVTTSSLAQTDKMGRETAQNSQVHLDRTGGRLPAHRPFNEVINNRTENRHSPKPSITARPNHANGFARSQTIGALQKRSEYGNPAGKGRRPKATIALDLFQVVHREVEQTCFLPPPKSRTQSPQVVTISANIDDRHPALKTPGGKVADDGIGEHDETPRLFAMEPIEVGFIFHKGGILSPNGTPKNVKFPSAEMLGN